MPFGSYQVSPEDAVRNAIRFVKEGGAQAVKLEGGHRTWLETIRRIVAAEIPVMGHVGLTPQAIHRMGGHRVQGRTGDDGRDAGARRRQGRSGGRRLRRGARGHPRRPGRRGEPASLDIPTIGIGAGVDCDGQVLVMHDLLGLSDWSPSFVKQYASLGAVASQAARRFAEEVSEAKFPTRSTRTGRPPWR